MGKGSSRFSSCNKVIIEILVTKLENLKHIPQLFVAKIKYVTCNWMQLTKVSKKISHVVF